ncbi:LOW QUALITY PROTEIN: protein borderless [Sabethes cyaneus]|uniref:LOW QUALITY PROTEIN: protein borderless n=1 Tax=Sabethes cyaneus TaxID=53552 RepID=UPI00237E6AF4|nr:LOW QUALITY PROTEIN: protein borderless [Sabethes cyaneus]
MHLIISCSIGFRKILPPLLLIIALFGLPATFGYLEERPPVYLEAKVGSYVILNCPVDFPKNDPIPYVLHWNKDNRPVFTLYDGKLNPYETFIGRVTLLNNDMVYGKASLNLTSIRESDNGWYECKVIFPNRVPNKRNNGTWFHISVLGGTLLKIPPVNQTVMEGDPAFFHCMAQNPETMFIEWYKDNVSLLQMYDLLHRSNFGPDGSLTINPTQMSDLGFFKCEVRNTMNDTQDATAFLNVQYKAKVIYAPKEVYLPFGEPAVLDCHFRSNPPLTNLRWEKDGFLFDPYNVQGVFYKRNGSIYFEKVDDSHAGRYSCTPYNDLGTDGPSPSINVIVQRPPVIVMKPKLLYVTKIGGTVEMHCDAKDRDGTHTPPISWIKKDGSLLPHPHGRYQQNGGNLTIEDIVESDRGIYACQATNEAATISADAEIMIENVSPRAPYNLTGNSSDTAITLRWAPGYIRQYLEYIIWYRLAEAPEWRTFKVSNKHVLEATITNLQPAKEYEFMVLCQDNYGDGMFSKAFRYFTKPKEFEQPETFQDTLLQFNQIGSPINLTIEKRNNNYEARWQPPELGLDQLRYYILRWWIEPQHKLHGSVSTPDVTYVLDDLDEDELYTFQVFAVSTTNYTSGSNEVEIYMYPYRRVKVITVSGVLILLVCLAVISSLLYMKRNRIKKLREAENVKI